jgi:hypothetical protein
VPAAKSAKESRNKGDNASEKQGKQRADKQRDKPARKTAARQGETSHREAEKPRNQPPRSRETEKPATAKPRKSIVSNGRSRLIRQWQIATIGNTPVQTKSQHVGIDQRQVVRCPMRKPRRWRRLPVGGCKDTDSLRDFAAAQPSAYGRRLVKARTLALQPVVKARTLALQPAQDF